MARHWPKEFLILHCIILALCGPVATVNYDYIITNIKLAQDVFPMVHTLTIVEPIWHMLQNVMYLLLLLLLLLLKFISVV